MDIKKVTVAGGGVLGSQIAFQSAYCGYDVTIWLRSEASIGRCQPKLDRLCEIYLQTLEAMKKDPKAYAYGLCAKDEVEAGHLDELKQQVRHAYSSINLTTSYEEAFGDADFVIEAIAENAEQKTAFYTTVVPYLSQKVIVVTNSDRCNKLEHAVAGSVRGPAAAAKAVSGPPLCQRDLEKSDRRGDASGEDLR